MDKLTLDIINTLTRRGYVLTGHVNDDQYYFQDERVTVELVTPHEGTDFKHMIRAEMIVDFHKFEDAQMEEFIEDMSDLGFVVFNLDRMKSVEYED